MIRIRTVRSRPGVDHFVSGSYPEALPPRQFDAIVFNDVLEHLVDPWSALRESKSFLTDGGMVIASIPNVRHYSVIKPLVVSGRFEYQDAGLLDRTHLRFFTFTSSVDLFESTGFRVTHVSHERITSSGSAAKLLSLLGQVTVPFRARHIAIAATL